MTYASGVDDRVLSAAIVRDAEEAIYAKDLNGYITVWNDAAARLYGFDASEIVGRSIELLVPEEKREELRLIDQRIRRGERIPRLDTVRTKRTGERLDISLTISPIRDKEHEVIGAASIAHDISWKKQAEEELERARDAAIVANRAKDHLLAVLSHELRTPLTPALAAVGLLASDPDLSAAIRAKVEVIRRNLELEARLVDDLLDLTSLVRQAPQLVRKVLPIADLLEHAIAICEPEIAPKGVRVDRDVEGDLFVDADEQRMQQVFWSLVRNAARFSALGGTIRIKAARAGDDAVIDVIDEGEGIDKTRLAMLFLPVEQGTKATNGTRGISIGLAAAKALVEAHGGRLEASSPGLGKGTRFRVVLPAQAPSSKRTLTNRQTPGMRVLLVEDHPDTAELMQEILELAGLQVEVALTAADAIESLNKNTFDLVVSDLGLPDASGHEVARAAKARFPNARMIALSGYGTSEDRRQSAEAGFDEHLTKPISVGDLQAALGRVLSSSR